MLPLILHPWEAFCVFAHETAVHLARHPGMLTLDGVAEYIASEVGVSRFLVPGPPPSACPGA